MTSPLSSHLLLIGPRSFCAALEHAIGKRPLQTPLDPEGRIEQSRCPLKIESTVSFGPRRSCAAPIIDLQEKTSASDPGRLSNACGSVVRGVNLFGALDQIVQIAPELLQREADPEQATERRRRKGAGQAGSPHLIQRVPVGTNSLGQRAGILGRLPAQQSLADPPQGYGAGPGRAQPGSRRMLRKCVVARLPRCATERAHVMAQPPHRPKQGLAIGNIGQPASPLACGLLHQGLKPDQAFARGHGQGAEFGLPRVAARRQRLELRGQEVGHLSGRLEDRA